MPAKVYARWRKVPVEGFEPEGRGVESLRACQGPISTWLTTWPAMRARKRGASILS
jgi:hypothetical protein